MRTIDLTPLYRSVVGFDRLAALMDAASTEAATGYPPYNIERTDENAYRIEIAVAGFKTEDLSIEVKENLLTVQGRKVANDDAKRYLHRGLAERNFERKLPACRLRRGVRRQPRRRPAVDHAASANCRRP